MSATEQLERFTAFARAITRAEGEEISLEEIYSRWWEEQHRDADLAAIEEAHRDYENGDRGRPVEEMLADFRRERASGNQQ